VSIPLGNLHNVGLRRVIKNGEVQKIVDFLTTGNARTTGATGEISASRKTLEKMRTGSLLEVAFVLRASDAEPEQALSFRGRRCWIAPATCWSAN